MDDLTTQPTGPGKLKRGRFVLVHQAVVIVALGIAMIALVFGVGIAMLAYGLGHDRNWR